MLLSRHSIMVKYLSVLNRVLFSITIDLVFIGRVRSFTTSILNYSRGSTGTEFVYSETSFRQKSHRVDTVSATKDVRELER